MNDLGFHERIHVTGAQHNPQAGLGIDEAQNKGRRRGGGGNDPADDLDKELERDEKVEVKEGEEEEQRDQHTLAQPKFVSPSHLSIGADR